MPTASLDDQGVCQLVDSLHGLPHFGEDLKRIVQVNEKAAEANFRERSCTVTAGRHWNRQQHLQRRSQSVRGQPDKAQPVVQGQSQTQGDRTRAPHEHLMESASQSETKSDRGDWPPQGWFPAVTERFKNLMGFGA